MNLTFILLLLSLISFLIELFTLTVFFVFIGLGFLGATIVSLFTQNIFIILGVGIIITLISIYFLRTLLMNKLKKIREEKSGFEITIGQKAKVIDEISSDPSKFGTVKIDGVIWNAREINEQKLEPGEIVKILKIDGSHLVVEKIKEEV